MTADARAYPDTLEIIPLTKPPRCTVRVPGSKSITNRALVLAALADPLRESRIQGALRSEDTEIMIDSLRALGFRLDADWDNSTIRVGPGRPCSRTIPAVTAELFTGNSGTSMRFLTALVSLGQGDYLLDGVARMRERPMEDLLRALGQLGVRAESVRGSGHPPIRIASTGLHGGAVRMRGDVSSQFLSGLLMAVPLATADTMVEVVGPLVSRPYVSMTVAMMRQFGATIDGDSAACFYVPGRQRYQAQRYTVEPDATAASYFFAAAAITGGSVAVLGIDEVRLQGDLGFVRVLEEMGCRVARETGRTTVSWLPVNGIDVDMNAMSDCTMTLAALACFAKGPTTIRNVAHIRRKESDRLSAMATELRRVGAGVEEAPDGLRITPQPLHGAVIDTYNDHRIAMSMALIGLRIPGIVIRDPGCVAKTYPGFFDDLAQLNQ